MSLLFINVMLAIAWGAMTGSFAPLNLIFGFCLAAIALSLIREQVGSVDYFTRLWRGTRLAAVFIVELVKSSVKVALLVLTPRPRLSPAIIAYPLTVDRDFEITLLANLITLTPGTLSLDVSDDRRTLFIHCIDAPDTDAVISDIRQSFERRILETFR